MGTEAVSFQKETNGEKTKIIILLLIASAVLMAESGLMALSLWKAPVLIQFIYDKVTLPQSLLFITHLKGLFAVVMMVVCCLPALILMAVTGFIMSKSVENKQSGEKKN